MKREWQAALMLMGIVVMASWMRSQAAAPDAKTASQSGQAAPGSASEGPAFEVASIKVNHSMDGRFSIRLAPGRYTTTGATAKMLITSAYGVKDAQVSGGPSWINTERFDIEAKEPDSVAQQLQKMPPEQAAEQVGLMVQSLLADRFRLVVSRPTKELPIYALVLAKAGAKLTPSNPAVPPDGFRPQGAMPPPPPPNAKPSDMPPGAAMMGPGHLTANGISISALVTGLSRQPELADRVIVDQTGLAGKYDIALQWTPENRTPGINTDEPASDSNAPSLFTALEEQLGLKVESTKGPVETLVIEQIEEPSEN